MSSSPIALAVRGVSKAYSITHNVERHTTLREAIVARLRHPVRRGAEIETFWALRELSFEVERGEVWGIIGRNGAGKSTLLKILSRITEPTTGEVHLYGRVGSLLEVGTGFHSELTGRENVYLNGAILGMRRREITAQFDAIVDFAEVEQFLDTPVKRYSSGMYVRLAFAVAAHLNPEILIVDEVLAVGDVEFQRKCLGKMEEVTQRQGRTVLFVSHNMGAVRTLCGRCIWLDKGGVIMEGAARDVVDAYLRTTSTVTRRAVDLKSASRGATFGHQLRFCRVELNEGHPVLHGELLRVRLEYEAHTDLQGVSFGFGLSTPDGVRLLTVDSDLTAPRERIPKCTSGSAEALLPALLLQPGIYALDIGARSGDGYAFDYLAGCMQVEVLPGPSTPGFIIRQGGGVRLPASWSWNTSLVPSESHGDGIACVTADGGSTVA